jgi:hypothetical protein
MRTAVGSHPHRDSPNSTREAASSAWISRSKRLGYARDKAAKASLKNVEFIAVDLSTFDTTGRSASWSSKIAGQCPAFKFFDAIQRVIFLRENTASDQKPFLLKAP